MDAPSALVVEREKRRLRLRHALRDAFGLYFLCDCCQETVRVNRRTAAVAGSDWLPDGWELCTTAGDGTTLLCGACRRAGARCEDDDADEN